MAEGHVQRMVATIVAEIAAAHVESKLADVFATPDQSALVLGIVHLIESVLERRLHTMAVLGAAPRNSSTRPADRPTQVLPACAKPTYKGKKMRLLTKRTHSSTCRRILVLGGDLMQGPTMKTVTANTTERKMSAKTVPTKRFAKSKR